jgi:hypothetical protein
MTTIEPTAPAAIGQSKLSQLKMQRAMQTKFRSRAALSTLIIFESFAVGITCMFLYAGIVRHVGWGGTIIGLVLCAVIFIWWRAFFVAVEDDELRYRTLFASRAIRLGDITKAVRKMEFGSKGNRPPFRIEVYGTVEGKDVNFDVNLKPFPRAAVRKLEQLLNIA